MKTFTHNPAKLLQECLNYGSHNTTYGGGRMLAVSGIDIREIFGGDVNITYQAIIAMQVELISVSKGGSW